ncbi:MAG: DNA topoisomerase 1 [Rhodobacteraceae bacterium]|nr:DNA topoisomerase 1 [Paracoccaceae bacterium]|tara:strand:+ start:8490 stop:10817 length:2328 start_codon:yes stop_codon:yes gene_type:complete
MTKLVIVESPAKCRKIESYLGKGYKCVASFGHIRQLGGPRDGLKCIDFDNNFKPSFVLLGNKKKYMSNLTNHIKKASEVILATDDDREGEAIAWHICKVFKLSIENTKRIIFHEITKQAIQNAVANPIRLDMNKVYAQQSRQILDKIVGFKLSPLLYNYISKKPKHGLSAGRCQTPALRIVFDNQAEIDKSPGKKVYDTIGIFTKKNLQFKLNHNHNTEDKIGTFLENTVNHDHIYSLSKVREGVEKKQPLPFTTSTLQQKASNCFGYSPKRTMRLAQTLYENGYITYMRTDSKKYSKEFIALAKKFIMSNYGKNYVNKSVNKLANNVKQSKTEKKAPLAQEAHEAIRPTKIETKTVSHLPNPEQKLYKLIWENTIESCMSPAIYSSITANISAPEKYKYKYSVEIAIFLGWQIVCGALTHEPKIYKFLNEIKKGTIMKYKKITSKLTLKELKTHFTEARLVQMLEKKGIGRPSTFSSLISKIQDRDYVKKQDVNGKEIKCIDFELIDSEITENETKRVFGNEKNKLVLQPLGKLVIEYLIKNFDNLFVYDYTKSMEDTLDLISKGKYVWHKLCKNCNNEIESLTKNIDKSHKAMFQIDEQHTYLIGKYGPCIKKEENGKTSFLPIKKNIDLDKLRQGEYTLKDLVDTNKSSSNGRKLGEYKDNDVILRNGKFGLYVNYNNKNYSVKLLSKNIDEIELNDIIPVLDGKKSLSNPNILHVFDDTLSIRKGKFGPYIFYKAQYMKKPKFMNFKGKDWKNDFNNMDDLRSWISSEFQV